jgi:putative ABC transport system substrate-binding protein
MKRRYFIAGLGVAAVAGSQRAWGQQQTRPLIGFAHSGSSSAYVPFVNAFRQGLRQTGFVQGENVDIQFRWGENQRDPIAGHIAELVDRNVSVLVIGGGDTGVRAAKSATSTIPIVVALGNDPVQAGFVNNLSRPGGNLTGISVFAIQLVAKRLELAREFVANGEVVAFLENPSNPNSRIDSKEFSQAAEHLRQKFVVAEATTESECVTAFAALMQQGAKALIVQSDPFFNSVVEQLVALAASYVIPVVFPRREFALAGGLMSYGSSLSEAYRQVGIYTGRVLRGDRPGDLPFVFPTRYELVINLKTAKSLDLTMPTPILLRADEVIE